MSTVSTAELRASDPVLAGVISSKVQREDRFIASRALHRIDVDSRDCSGKLWKANHRSFSGQQQVSLRRAEGAVIPLIRSGAPTTVSYDCEEFAGKLFLDSRTRKRSQYPDDLRDVNLAEVRRTLLDDYERAMATLLFTGSNWGSNTSTLALLPGYSGQKFGVSGADEISDMAVVCETIEGLANAKPTNAIFGRAAWNKLKKAASLRDYLGNDTNRTRFSDSLLMSLLLDALELDEILVGRARTETANDGQPSAMADIWGDSVLFYHKGTGGTQLEGGARVGLNTAVTVHEMLDGTPDTAEAGNGLSLAGWEWESKDPPGTYQAGGHSFDMLITEQDSGYLLTSVT